ncbi:MAG: aspartate-semialdehyde dehydrogenase [Chloroflexi bacterium]|nr:aspartate-semialdehyde dehydrogenase [Chloroflexota bacterium]
MATRVGVVGATGVVGQQFVVALQRHPWFTISWLAASERSAHQTYGEALRDKKTGARRWFCAEEPLREVLDLPVEAVSEFDPSRVDLLFTAIESDQARELEPAFARTTPVISTASAFRYEADVPLIIPGVNSDHARLLRQQQERRGWKGFIAPNPNCTTVGLAITLRPLHQQFGVQAVLMTSLQSMSGAGRSPGVLGLDIIDNIIPYIPGEEEKVQAETQKILGTLEENGVRPAPFGVSCTCTRVNVSEGHTEAVFVGLGQGASVDEVKEALASFAGDFAGEDLPSAPARLIVVRDDPFRPQPRLDRTAEDGMATVVGRVRADGVLANGVKYLLVSHNTKMGAAKGCVLTAEVLVSEGYIGGMAHDG